MATPIGRGLGRVREKKGAFDPDMLKGRDAFAGVRRKRCMFHMRRR
jgi:hypothetical protein